MAGRGGSDPKCILLNDGKVTKKPWVEASELVEAGKARFISHTEFRAHVHGVKVPADIKKQGDRAVKDFITSKSSPVKAKASDESGEHSESGGRKARKSKD